MSMDALGGPGIIIQIDESLFRPKPKVSESNSEDKVLGLICNVFKSPCEFEVSQRPSCCTGDFGI